ncbi:MAG: hypothetical protein IJ733_09380 [Lachnospiraceae bacterium]|nr:hypothetical protein [Lachnospiraceae bacterium]
MEQIMAAVLLSVLVFSGPIGLLFKWLIHQGRWDEIRSQRAEKTIRNHEMN